jgi:hypothetical protein
MKCGEWDLNPRSSTHWRLRPTPLAKLGHPRLKKLFDNSY